MTFDKSLKQIKEIFTGEESQEQIKLWELEHKKAELWGNLGQHPAMQELISKLQDDLIGIDLQLGEQEVMGQDDILKRLNLKNKKELYAWFLNLFLDAKDKIVSIEKEVNENIENHE